MQQALGVALLLAVAGCATRAPVCLAAPGGDTAYIIDRGWHVDLGIAVGSLDGGLAMFRDVFPGARAVVFGYGKRTFLTAPPDDWSEYLLGPIPGRATIEVAGLLVLPDAAYAPGEVTALPLPPGGAARLSAFIWRDFASAHRIGLGHGTLFYAANSRYSLLHTCNTWAADALAAADARISAADVILSGQVKRRAVAAGSCRAPPVPQ